MVTRKLGCVAASVLLAALLAAPAGADEWAYRWVDKDGVVQYTQQPPPGVPSERIKVRQGFSERAQDQQPAPTPAEQDEAKRQEYCTGARHNLEMLASNEEIWRKDDKGESTRMTPEERKAETERTQKAVDLYCSGEAPAAAPAQ